MKNNNLDKYDGKSVEEIIKILLDDIYKEKYRLKGDLSTKRNTGVIEDLENEGKIINNLTCEKYKNKDNTKFLRKENITTNIKKGDYVLLTIDGTNIREELCKIKRIGSNYVIVSLKEKISKVNKNNTAKIEFFCDGTPFRRWEKNLKNLGKFGRKALMLALNRIADEIIDMNKKISFFNNSLDEYQKEAVKGAISCNDFFLIHGPFGTGKTTTIIELILQEVKLAHKILVTGESNNAVNNILERLSQYDNINVTRVGASNKISDYLKKYDSKYKVKNYSCRGSDKKIEEIEEEILFNSQVILSTNSSVAILSSYDIEFDTVIIDEASQATIPSLLIPIDKAKKFILIGDHKQLPPVLNNDEAEFLKTSLFEELITKYKEHSQQLLIQYRMNETLMKFPNKYFYENKLICSEESKNNYLDIVLDKYDSNSPLIFVDTSKKYYNEKLGNSNSFVNELEAKIVGEIVDMYLKKGINKEDIGIISPYAQQVRLIQEKTIVEVNSVDGFQGREKDIIIVSLVRSNDDKNIGFLNNMNRLNVLLTRSRKKLIVVGNSNTLKTNDVYKEFLEFCDDEGVVIKEF